MLQKFFNPQASLAPSSASLLVGQKVTLSDGGIHDFSSWSDHIVEQWKEHCGAGHIYAIVYSSGDIVQGYIWSNGQFSLCHISGFQNCKSIQELKILSILNHWLPFTNVISFSTIQTGLQRWWKSANVYLVQSGCQGGGHDFRVVSMATSATWRRTWQTSNLGIWFLKS